VTVGLSLNVLRIYNPNRPQTITCSGIYLAAEIPTKRLGIAEVSLAG